MMLVDYYVVMTLQLSSVLLQVFLHGCDGPCFMLHYGMFSLPIDLVLH